MLALLLSFLNPSRAETAEEIVAKARAANQVASSVQHLKLTLVGKNGTSRVTELDLKSKRTDDASFSYMRVTAPSLSAGTTFLMIDRLAGADEQMMYTPATKTLNLIAASNRKGAFLGSDFTFEDFEFRDATAGGMTLAEDAADHWVLETTPSGSAYTKVRVTIGKSTLVIQKVEFFDANGLLKVLEVKETAVDNGVTLAVRTEMTNVVKGTKTVIEIQSHQLNVGPDVLPDETFTRAYLERG